MLKGFQNAAKMDADAAVGSQLLDFGSQNLQNITKTASNIDEKSRLRRGCVFGPFWRAFGRQGRIWEASPGTIRDPEAPAVELPRGGVRGALRAHARAGQLELQVAEDFFADGHQSARAGLLIDGQLGDASQAVVLELGVNAVRGERLFVLADDAALACLENLLEVID